MKTPGTTERRADDERRTEFERVMRYATERAWEDDLEEQVMAALFDVLNGQDRPA